MGLLSLVGVVVMAAAPEAPTAQALMELAARQAAQQAPAGGDAVPTGLMLAVMGQAKELLSPEGLPLDGAAEEWLRKRVLDRLKAELATLPPRPGVERRDAWERLTRAAMTAQLAQDTLDDWLGLPPLTGPDGALASGQWTQVTQLEGADTFALHHVAVVEELGSAGSNNKLIDPGEWVRLELTFTNATKQPWFSTTGFPQVQGCAWADASRGAILEEAGPGAQASLSLWLYLPAECTSPSTLKVSLSDTHRGSPPRGVTLEVKPMEFARPRATRLRLDADALGSSDGSRRERIGPLTRFELVADLLVPGALVSKVEPRWAAPKRTAALFESLLYRAVPAVPQGGGLYAAGDDLDGETVDADAWRALAQHQELEPWLLQPASGRLWFALDTVVTMTQPPATAPSAMPGGPAGKLAPSARPAPAPAVSPAPTPVPVSVVTKLVQQYVSLVPHPVPHEQPEAITAASGFEVLFDRAGFGKAYEALLAPPTTAQAPASPSAVYVTRTYLAVPALAVPKTGKEEAEQPPLQPPPPTRQAPARAAAPTESQPPLVQLDLGGGVAVFGVRPTRASNNLWTGLDVAAFPSGTVRTFIGPHVVGTAGVNLNGLAYTFGTNAATWLEVSGDLGAGYRLRWERLWLTPYLAATLRYRQHSHVGDPEFAVGGLVGVNLRVRLIGPFGLSLDVAMPFGISGPEAIGVDSTLIGIVSGVGLRATLGLSFAF